MKTLIRKKVKAHTAKKQAQCCAKTSPIIAGCHD